VRDVALVAEGEDLPPGELASLRPRERSGLTGEALAVCLEALVMLVSARGRDHARGGSVA
jgi:hypothetical protein